jgi:hypothetical protein
MKVIEHDDPYMVYIKYNDVLSFVHIRVTSFPCNSGRSTSNSSLNAAYMESPRIIERPKLHTRVMA